jgi:deoxyadenosine/deoxycytidine kinase
MLYAEYMRGEHIISDAEFSFYEELCDMIQANYRIPALPDAFVYVSAPPELCMKRLHVRGQAFQTDSVQLEYLHTLHRYLEAMADTVDHYHPLRVPVLRLDTAEDDLSTLAGRERALFRCVQLVDEVRSGKEEGGKRVR